MTNRPRILTPIVIGAGIIVAVSGLANIALMPELTARWVLGILFLPVAVTLIHLALRNQRWAQRIGQGGGIRAGLVGAGVALASAFTFSLTDHMGWTGEESFIPSGTIWVFLFAGIAIGIDLIGARLESKAEKDPDD